MLDADGKIPSDRIDVDATLSIEGAAADAKAVGDAIRGEEEAREAADGVLQSAIDSEIRERTEADTTLQSAIDGEATQRAETDASL